MFNGITYLGNRFSLKITSGTATVVFQSMDDAHPLRATRNPEGKVVRPTIGTEIVIKKDESLIFEAVSLSFGECKMKETKLGNGSGKIITSMLLIFMSLMTKFLI